MRAHTKLGWMTKICLAAAVMFAGFGILTLAVSAWLLEWRLLAVGVLVLGTAYVMWRRALAYHPEY